ncbi:hypothetical protein P7K49_013431 [Saguinus oedipus]|uniref:Uncharacterized protein n=1 Tax=Saguinus oedipus TaxID=9490 RepID=A0ABQ9VFW6_SAGOE|nr:hypothetical protein P7K49_013431 [Saguinus oedipus]
MLMHTCKSIQGTPWAPDTPTHTGMHCSLGDKIGDIPHAPSSALGLCIGQGLTIIKEGMLTKQNNSFQRSKRRYFKLRGRTLYYAKTAKDLPPPCARWRNKPEGHRILSPDPGLLSAETLCENILHMSKGTLSIIFDEVDLTDASVAESSTKNVNNSFTSISKS